MIEGLESLLGAMGPACSHELKVLLQELIGRHVKGRLLSEEKLKWHRVYRLRFEIEDGIRSIVVKRLTPALSQLERTVVHRWLPQVGLGENGSPLIGVAAEREGGCIWHIYEDLGNSMLDRGLSAISEGSSIDRGFLSPLRVRPEQENIEAVICLVSEVHKKFKEHFLLSECRQLSCDYGINYLSANVNDAIRVLNFLEPGKVPLTVKNNILRKKLLERLYMIHGEIPWRSQFVNRKGGPQTLLHGDLGVKNTFIMKTDFGLNGRLIDWDHVGVGPISYDLSTFLTQLPIRDRMWSLEFYQKLCPDIMPQWPTSEEWNVLFETHEYARLSNCIIWPAIEAVKRQSEWAYEDLEKVNYWFDAIEPVLQIF